MAANPENQDADPIAPESIDPDVINPTKKKILLTKILSRTQGLIQTS